MHSCFAILCCSLKNLCCSLILGLGSEIRLWFLKCFFQEWQRVLIQEHFLFVHSLLSNQGMPLCVVGWAEVTGVSCLVYVRSAFVCSNSIKLFCVPSLSNQVHGWVERFYITETLSFSVTSASFGSRFYRMASVHVRLSLHCDFFMIYWWAVFQRERKRETEMWGKWEMEHFCPAAV